MVITDVPLLLPDDPLQAFQTWLNDAHQASVPEPTAMTLATATAEGRPDARIVLFKGLSEGGFSFFTNYTSRKARELDANPRAALVFFWVPLKRQIRIEGQIERVSAEESDAYFHSRPRGSQIGAWASPQSQVIESREALVEKVREAEGRFGDGPIPRPAHWGGYRVRPDRIEFWEERPSRLHERHVYEKTSVGWSRRQVAP